MASRTRASVLPCGGPVRGSRASPVCEGGVARASGQGSQARAAAAAGSAAQRAGAQGALSVSAVRAPCAAGLAQHREPGEGDLQARLVSDRPQAGPGRHRVPLHPHAVLPGREVAPAGAALPRGAAVLPAHGADAGAWVCAPGLSWHARLRPARCWQCADLWGRPLRGVCPPARRSTCRRTRTPGGSSRQGRWCPLLSIGSFFRMAWSAHGMQGVVHA